MYVYIFDCTFEMLKTMSNKYTSTTYKNEFNFRN